VKKEDSIQVFQTLKHRRQPSALKKLGADWQPGTPAMPPDWPIISGPLKNY